jgi:hypothetical protein
LLRIATNNAEKELMLSPSQEGSRSIAGSEDEGSGEEKINTLISVPQRGMRAATMGRSTTCKNDDDSSGGEEETADHAGVDEQGEAEQLKNGKETEPQSKDFIGKDEDISPTGFKRDVDDDVSSDEEESSHENGDGKLIPADFQLRFQLFCNTQLIKYNTLFSFLFLIEDDVTTYREGVDRLFEDYHKNVDEVKGGECLSDVEDQPADLAEVDEQGEAKNLASESERDTEQRIKDLIEKNEIIHTTGLEGDVDDDVSSDEEESSHENGYGKLIRFQLFCNTQLIKVRYFPFCFSLKTTLLRTARGLTDYSKTITRMLTRGRVESVLVMSKTNLRTSLESMSREKLTILRVRVRETRNNRYQT